MGSKEIKKLTVLIEVNPETGEPEKGYRRYRVRDAETLEDSSYCESLIDPDFEKLITTFVKSVYDDVKQKFVEEPEEPGEGE